MRTKTVFYAAIALAAGLTSYNFATRILDTSSRDGSSMERSDYKDTKALHASSSSVEQSVAQTWQDPVSTSANADHAQGSQAQAQATSQISGVQADLEKVHVRNPGGGGLSGHLGRFHRHGLLHRQVQMPEGAVEPHSIGTPPAPSSAEGEQGRTRAFRTATASSQSQTHIQHMQTTTSTNTQTNIKPVPEQARGEEGKRKIHVVMTANEATYVAWQSRVMYYWYQKVKAANPDSDLGGFTRVLHSGRPDGLMNEIPTVVVQPLPRGVDQGYVVLNRPFAFVQFFDKVVIKEDYIMMAEPDHLMLQAIPNWATPTQPVAFPFFYINPQDPALGPIAQRFNEGNHPIDPIGNSPVIIHKDQLKPLVSKWHDLALRLKRDSSANKAFGWVLEMWAYAIAAAQMNIRHELHDEFMLQPPYDNQFYSQKTKKPAMMIHYTYGNDYDMQGRFTPGRRGAWRFDKRSHIGRYPPRNLALPPKGTNQVVVKLIEMINEASANLDWPNT
mmetsp:Transcript_33623/g.63237  ORF Transcript_33623/g.63237 Transcript_33623/m.63237 type:complete len:501 (+) Transcript_33623:122-1624(+)